MKKLITPVAAFCAAVAMLTSCQKDAKDVPSGEISPETLAQIKGLGFNSSNVQRTDGGYLVEGDIVLSDADLKTKPSSQKLLIANEEQYNTFNLVKAGGGRTITVSVSGTVSSAFSLAVDHAIARYNAQRLTISFSRVSSGGAINIRLVNTGQYIASSGFPDSKGDPYPEVKYANKYASGYSDGFLTTVLTHEIGHCIGFRHTDYMNRAYSCGSGGNEGASTIGAVLIPGTPSGPDPNSWMLACLGATTDRPFNKNDITALNYLY